MSEFNKVSGYKINIQKSVVLLCTNKLEREIKRIIQFIIAWQSINNQKTLIRKTIKHLKELKETQRDASPISLYIMFLEWKN